jgi:hypothetical protein
MDTKKPRYAPQLYQSPQKSNTEISFDEWSEKRKTERIQFAGEVKHKLIRQKSFSPVLDRKFARQVEHSVEENTTTSSVLVKIQHVLSKQKNGINACYLNEIYKSEYKQTLPANILTDMISGKLKEIVSVHRIYFGDCVKTILYPKIKTPMEEPHFSGNYTTSRQVRCNNKGDTCDSETIRVRPIGDREKSLKTEPAKEYDTRKYLHKLIVNTIRKYDDRKETALDCGGSPNLKGCRLNGDSAYLNESIDEYFDSVENPEDLDTSHSNDKIGTGFKLASDQCQNGSNNNREESNTMTFDQRNISSDESLILQRLNMIFEQHGDHNQGLNIKFLSQRYSDVYGKPLSDELLASITEGKHKNKRKTGS